MVGAGQRPVSGPRGSGPRFRRPAWRTRSRPCCKPRTMETEKPPWMSTWCSNLHRACAARRYFGQRVVSAVAPRASCCGKRLQVRAASAPVYLSACSVRRLDRRLLRREAVLGASFVAVTDDAREDLRVEAVADADDLFCTRHACPPRPQSQQTKGACQRPRQPLAPRHSSHPRGETRAEATTRPHLAKK